MAHSEDTDNDLDYIDRRHGDDAPNTEQRDDARYVNEAARQAAHRRKLALTTIGSTRVDIEATPAAFPEAEGGVTLWVRHARGTPLEEATAYALTAAEAKQLVCAVADVITPELFRLPERGSHS
jgi:hypothetical protein